MTKARPVLPTDVVALISSARAGRNEAWPRERVHKSDASLNLLSTMFGRFLGPSGKRGAWISAEGRRLHGLVGARRRGGKRAWEIDYLADTSPDQDAVLDLLECVVAATGRSGGEKVFLRLRDGSPLMGAAKQAGFLPYKEETLYAHEGLLPPAKPAAGLRTAVSADSYRIFRLYCESTPESVRRLEGATFGEWQAANENRWLQGGLTLVEEINGELTLVVSAAQAGNDLCLSWMARRPSETDIAGVISAASAILNLNPKLLQVLAPKTPQGLESHLLNSGFEAQRSFAGLVRRTTRPVALAKPLPAVARSVAGA